MGVNGAAGIWKREAEAEPEAWGTYGYSGLGYGGAYSTGYATGYSVAAPVYGYSTPAYTTGYGGIWKREADAGPEADAEAWGTYGYSGLGGLGYGGAYGTGYATGYSTAAIAPHVIAAAPAVVARPAIAVTRTAIPITQTTHVPITRTRVETVPVGVQTRVVSGGIVNGAAGIWKREAEAEPEAWGTYGYSGLGYGGAYSTGYATGYSVAAPVYGYSTPAYTTGYGGIWKREADAGPEADAEAWGT